MNKWCWLVLALSGFLMNCAQVPKAEIAERTERSERVKEYEVIDWSHKEVPEWANLMNSTDLESLEKSNQYKYFVGESDDNIFDRSLACSNAELNIKKSIATEITSELESTSSSQASQVDGSVERTEIQSKVSRTLQKLHGVDKRSTYWEKRDYSKKGSTKPVFNCKVLARIPKTHFNELLEAAGKKLVSAAKATPSAAPSADKKSAPDAQ